MLKVIIRKTIRVKNHLTNIHTTFVHTADNYIKLSQELYTKLASFVIIYLILYVTVMNYA